MSRTQQDSIIDDDEETCPLCIEEFDLSDKNFRPCPCGYQICQFCFNSLKTTYEKSNCPNCRRPYDEKTIQYKVPTAEEFKLDQQNKNRKQAAAKRKETEKREVETSSRRNLAGVRVKQTNLVYVIGLIPTIKDETSLLQTLRGQDYFGQYGEIEKIVVSKAKASSASQGIGVYVTYARKEDAALCIQTVDGSANGERVLRAQYGTTKYCSAFLRGEVCNNRNCSFLHETGEDGQTTSQQNEPNCKLPPKPSYSTQTPQMPPPARPTPPTSSATISSQPMARQNSKEESDSRKGSADASALPSSASWANVNNAQVTRARRASQTASNSTSSPSVSNSIPASVKAEDLKARDSANSTPAQLQGQPSSASHKITTNAPLLMLSSGNKSRPDPFAANKALFDTLLQQVSSNDFRFVFDESAFTEEELSALDQQPVLIDPYGGAKRRLMLEKEKAEQEKLEAEAQATQEVQTPRKLPTNEAPTEEETLGSGSLALGGEPEDDPRSVSNRGAIQRPVQTNSGSNFMNDQFSSMNINGINFTPQGRQAGQTGSGNAQRAPGLTQTLGTTGSELFDFDQRSLQISNQNQFDTVHTHQRQNSRYFNNDSSKPTAASKFPGQQQFYSSGVQGPPPGLPTAGTPPISGGGMFAHGQGFTSTANPGFGNLKDGNQDTHLRGRSGTNDISKLDESEFPALPTSVPGQARTIHSRVSSFQTSSTGRPSTPKIPPGFDVSHRHPSPSAAQLGSAQPSQSKLLSQTSGTVLPAVPILPIGQRVPTPKLRLKVDSAGNSKDDKAGTSPVNDLLQESEISSFSPKPKFVPFRPDLDKSEHKIQVEEPPPTDDESKADSAPGNGTPSSAALVESPPALTRPTRIEIPAVMTDTPVLKDILDVKSITPILASTVVQTPPAMNSRPTTPATTTSEISRASISRPRTIRVTTNVARTGSDTAPPSAVTEKSITTPSLMQSHLKQQPQRSRAQSITSAVSQSRPSTPALSDRLSMTNDILSGANSTPLSIIGSAPERTKTKAQLKKERKEKTKKTTEVTEAGTSNTPSTPPVVEEVAPVIGRARKVKKHREGTNADSAKDIESKSKSGKGEDGKVLDGLVTDSGDTSQEASKGQTSATASKRKESKNVLQLPEARREKADLQSTDVSTQTAKEEPDFGKLEDVKTRRIPYTLLDLYTESAKHKADPLKIQKLLSEHVSSINKIFESMLEANEIEPASALFGNQPSLNSASFKIPPDSRKGAEYLVANGYTDSNPFGQIYLGPKEKKALWNGENFGVADEREGRQGDLLRRALITGGGVVYRHLAREQEDRVMELEARKQHYAAQWGDIGTMNKLGKLEADDYINIEGGVEALIRHGDKHGIGWVVGQQRDEWDDDADADNEETDQFDDDFEDEDDKTEDLGLGNDPGTHRWEAAAATGVSPRALAALSSKKAAAAKASMVTHPVNLRDMDSAQLQRRVLESQREVDAAKREMEKTEKMILKKVKEVAKWREGFAALKA